DQIILKGGLDLEQTYTALTGKPGGYKALTDLLGLHVPAPAAPPSDDPFPLDWTRATVQISATQTPKAGGLPHLAVARGKVTTRPFFLCPPAEYQYETFATHNTLRFVAAVTGFGTPACSWRLNGTPIDGAGTTTVNTGFAADDPAQPDGVPFVATEVDIDYVDRGDIQSYAGHAFTLELSADKLGHIALDVEAAVIENVPGANPVHHPGLPPRTAAGHAVLDTERTIYLDPFAADKQKCTAEFDKFGKFHTLRNALTGHNPGTVDALRQASTIHAELTRLAEQHPKVAEAAGQALTERIGGAPINTAPS
ncbi:MAG TPA: hypothetical protein VE441_06415, partial [Mycobacterium sp.]|nr:hypothetical protein [Mycobacterium sp.]